MIRPKSRRVGQVYLIGAGPGDPGLLTIKGRTLLGKADAVVYDYLVNPRLLEETRPDAQLIYVGKRAGQHTLSQTEINELLIELAGAGKLVARLKGGDPFVFGRGGEEAQALTEAGIGFEVVPGVSSPVAAAAYAGIPLTHRDFTSSFTVITGHEDPRRPDDDSRLDWSALARVGGTLVFLMGVSRLPQITERLTEAGLPPRTPVAVIEWGTTWQQRTVRGDLTSIAEVARDAGIKPPAITVVGEVAGLREQLQWFDLPSVRPLLGKRIVVSHTGEHSNAEIISRLSDLGAGAFEFPVARPVAPTSFEALDRAISELADFDWLIFPDAPSVEFFWRRLWAARLDSRRLAHLGLVATGPSATTALEERGMIPDLVLDATQPSSLLHRLGDLANLRALLPCAEGGVSAVATSLRSQGLPLREVAAYQMATDDYASNPAQMLAWLEGGQVDLISFGSAQSLQDFALSLATVTERPLVKLLEGLPLLAAGSAIHEARALGLKNFQTHPATTDGLVEAVLNRLSPAVVALTGEG